MKIKGLDEITYSEIFCLLTAVKKLFVLCGVAKLRRHIGNRLQDRTTAKPGRSEFVDYVFCCCVRIS
jgi:hypothetical protein